MITINEVHNNGDGTYDVTFSQAVTLGGTGGTEPNLLFYSPSENQWTGCEPQNQPQPTIVTYAEANLDDDCTRVALMEQPSFLTPSTGYATAVPIIVVT